jgi:hypothetical protein
MDKQRHTTTRRTVLKRIGGISAVPYVSTESTAQPSPAGVILRPDDIPEEYNRFSLDVGDSSFFETLADVNDETTDAELSSNGFLWYDDGQLIGGIGSVAIRYPANPPQYQTLREVMSCCFDGFADEFGQDATTTVMTNPETQVLEWCIEVANPNWEVDVGYSDVTRVQSIAKTVIGTVVYGPMLPDKLPRDLAQRYSTLSRKRATK